MNEYKNPVTAYELNLDLSKEPHLLTAENLKKNASAILQITGMINLLNKGGDQGVAEITLQGACKMLFESCPAIVTDVVIQTDRGKIRIEKTDTRGPRGQFTFDQVVQMHNDLSAEYKKRSGR
jgi:hypothetical protein